MKVHYRLGCAHERKVRALHDDRGIRDVIPGSRVIVIRPNLGGVGQCRIANALNLTLPLCTDKCRESSEICEITEISLHAGPDTSGSCLLITSVLV